MLFFFLSNSSGETKQQSTPCFSLGLIGLVVQLRTNQNNPGCRCFKFFIIVPLPTPDAPIITKDFKLLDIFIKTQIIYMIQTQLIIIILLQMQNYKIQTKKGQGTYSVVYEAVKRNGPSYQKYALKIMKHPYQNLTKIKKDKQIKALHMFNHPNIIKLIDVLFDQKNQKMALVFELMDSNLYQFYKNKKVNGGNISLQRIRSIVHDILTAVSFIHKKGIFHRDIKPQNVLIKGDRIVKLADFGSCKKDFMSDKPYTQYISTRWYRAPQCLMTDGYYSEQMDVWSVGCILFQLYSLFPLFPGKSQADQITTIFSILGTPSKQKLQKFQHKASHMKFQFTQSQGIGIQALIGDAPPQMINLLYKMLQIDPDDRITIDQALNHPFFYSLTQLKKYQSRVMSKIVEHKESILPPIAKNKRYQ